MTYVHRALIPIEELLEPVREHALGQRVDGGADAVHVRAPLGETHPQHIPIQSREAAWRHLNREDVRGSEQDYAATILPARSLVQGAVPHLPKSPLNPIGAPHHHALKVLRTHAQRRADAERAVGTHAHVDVAHAATMERYVIGAHANHALALCPTTCDH